MRKHIAARAVRLGRDKGISLISLCFYKQNEELTEDENTSNRIRR
jgi:hypothetical protein